MRVDIWSDVVCPWCYIGKRRFEQALAAFEHRDQVQVVHRSFLLNPQLPPGEVIDREDMLMRKYSLTREQVHGMHARLEETAAADGLEYHLSGGVSGNSLDAHRLVHLGHAQGKQDAVIERLFRAYFTEQRSVFEPAALTALAIEAGLEEADVSRTLATDAYRDAVLSDLEEARAFGANGVPFFVFAQRYRLSGAHPVEIVAGALTRAWSETHAFQEKQ
jgi:predicted DsbA family dithiol-disulfide isomerase